MALDKEFNEIPGTIVFDAEQSRKGYWLNQFCMSLMKAENRARFKANERAYLDEWKMTEEQKQAVLDRDLNRMMALGGNIYFLSKIGATDGKSFQQMAGSMTGMSEQEYRDMMVKGGRKIDGNRRIGEDGDAQRPRRTDGPRQRTLNMARITASLYTSHIPAVGAAFDLGKTKEDYWKPVFAGYDFDKQWMKTHKPDVIFAVYNDHATAFSLQMIPTFAIMTGPEFNPADEGYGARPVPKVIGDPELASYIASEVIQQDFDLTMVNEIDVDHGLTVPLSCVFGEVKEWPAKIIPVRGQCRAASRALRGALLRARPGDRQGDRELSRGHQRPYLGHRRHEPPASGAARGPDQQGMGQRLPRPADRRPQGPLEDAEHRLRPRGGKRRDRACDVADRARRDVRYRRGRPKAESRAPVLPCPRIQHRGRASHS